MIFPSFNTKFDQRLTSTMIVWLFALVGMLATGVNLQASAVNADTNVDKTDSSQVFVFSRGCSPSLVLESDGTKPTLDTIINSFADTDATWCFIGFRESADRRTPTHLSTLYIRPQLRAPPAE